MVSRAFPEAEVADASAGVVRFDGGLPDWVPDDHNVSDLVWSEVGVPENQVSWAFLARRDAHPVPHGQPAALSGRCAWQFDADLCIGGLSEAGAVPDVRAGGAHSV